MPAGQSVGADEENGQNAPAGQPEQAASVGPPAALYKPAPHWYAARRDDVGDADGDAVTPVIVADGVAVGESDGDADGTKSSVSAHAALARTTRKPAPAHGPGTTADATVAPAASMSETVAAPVHAGRPLQPAHEMLIAVTARAPPVGHVLLTHGAASS